MTETSFVPAATRTVGDEAGLIKSIRGESWCHFYLASALWHWQHGWHWASRRRDGETDLRREISRRHVTDLARAECFGMSVVRRLLSLSVSPGSSVCLSKHSVFRQPMPAEQVQHVLIESTETTTGSLMISRRTSSIKMSIDSNQFHWFLSTVKQLASDVDSFKSSLKTLSGFWFNVILWICMCFCQFMYFIVNCKIVQHFGQKWLF